MRVVVVSQYFSPEVGATQNRMDSFVSALLSAGDEVTVICEQPNHPQGVFRPGYGRRPRLTERVDGLTVHRLWVAASPKRSTLRRIAFYATFAAGAFSTCAALPSYDVLLATSPPLPGAVAAAWAARFRRVPYVLDVRDLWPAAAAALGELSNARAIALLGRVERALYRHAEAVTATTPSFCDHIDGVRGSGRAVFLPNGALDSLVERSWDPPPRPSPFTVGYFGNLGIAQGLEVVLDAAAHLGDRVRFLLVGDGPRSAEIRRAIADRHLTNVVLRSQVPLSEVGDLMAACHALLVPLADEPIFTQFVPSKLYDAMAVGRPVLLSAAGESAAVLLQSDAGIATPPGDGAALAGAASRMAGDPQLCSRLGASGRRAATRYARKHQAARLVEVVHGATSRGSG